MSAEPRIAGFSANVRAEGLDGSHLCDGWGIFHRYGSIEGTEAVHLPWDGYVDVGPADGADPMWFTPPFRVVPEPPDHGPALPTMTVRARHWSPLDGGRIGLLVVEDAPTTDP